MSALRPVEVPAAAELVSDRLRRAIHLGTFAPGEQLPAERELAIALGVSRMTLREALRDLARHGYIVTRRGARGGSTVTVDHAALQRRLAGRVGEFESILQFREIVEGGAARLAAQGRDRSQLGALRRSLTQLEEARSAAAFRRADSAFHLAIATAAGNPVLVEAVRDARERLFAPTDVLPFDLRVATTAEAHTRILGAISRRDGEEAASAMEAHIRATGREFRTALGLG